MAQSVVQPQHIDNLQAFDTLFLDMDGTLLDLHFDSYFWRYFLPQQYAQIHQLDEHSATQHIYSTMETLSGTLNWYCLDYWTQLLNVPILALKQKVSHLIAVHPYADDFLAQSKQSGKRLFLVTNAHRDGINLKMKHAPIAHYFDDVISAHDYGHAKESDTFWQTLEQKLSFDKHKTLFFDDNQNVLNTAKANDIHCVAISKPSSQRDTDEIAGFTNIDNFSTLISPAIPP